MTSVAVSRYLPGRLRKKGRSYGLELVPARIRHIGTDLCKEVLKNIREHLEGKVTILFNMQVAQVIEELKREDHRFHMEGGSWTNNYWGEGLWGDSGREICRRCPQSGHGHLCRYSYYPDNWPSPWLF